MNTYEKIVEKGVKIGLEKGRVEGMEKGIQLKNKETIRKGFKKGLTIGDLADLTDLPESNVVEITEQLRQEGEL